MASYLKTAALRTSLLSVVSLVIAKEVFTISFSTSCDQAAVVVKQQMVMNNKSLFIISLSLFIVILIVSNQEDAMVYTCG